MNLKYVASKSRFIDLDAARPRLMKLETAAKLLESHGIVDPTAILQRIMRNPLPDYDAKTSNPVLKIIEQYQIVAQNDCIYVQGVAYTLQQALDFLIQRRNITDTDALRALAFAIDLRDLTK